MTNSVINKGKELVYITQISESKFSYITKGTSLPRAAPCNKGGGRAAATAAPVAPATLCVC